MNRNLTTWTSASIYNCEETELNQTPQRQKYSNNLSDYFLYFATIIAVAENKLGFSFLELPPGMGMVYQLFHFSEGQD